MKIALWMMIGMVAGMLIAQDNWQRAEKPVAPTITAIEGVRSVRDLPQPTVKPSSKADMFKALCMWEHRGVIRPDDVSSAGAVGPAQITPIFLKDLNIILDTDYTLTDCEDYETAFFLTRQYWAHYNLKTDEERARCHIAGPRGMTRKAVWAESTEYWVGVQTYLY